MAKRKTKAQRQEEQKAALRRRVEDILVTAHWGTFDDGESLFLEDVPRAVFAVKTLLLPGDAEDMLTGIHNVDEYANPVSLTDFLWRNGVRA